MKRLVAALVFGVFLVGTSAIAEAGHYHSYSGHRHHGHSKTGLYVAGGILGLLGGAIIGREWFASSVEKKRIGAHSAIAGATVLDPGECASYTDTDGTYTICRLGR